MQIVTSWEEQGRAIGLQQGIQQGETNLVIRQLTRRLGKLPRKLEKRVRALPIEQVEALADKLVDSGITDPAALIHWLDTHE